MRKLKNIKTDIRNLLPGHVLGATILMFSIFMSSCKSTEVPTIVVIKTDETYSPAKIRPV